MAWGIPRMSQNRELQRPLHDIAFWNGLRMMITMLIPVSIGVWMGQPKFAFMLGLGAMVMGIADVPGTNIHRRNGMIVAFFILVIAHGLVTTTNLFPIVQPVVLVVLAFLLSYMALYGSRASIIGSAGMLSMIFGLFAEATWQGALMSPLMIAIGAAFYFLISFTFMQMRPYRIVKQFLGESIQGIGQYIQDRALLYDVHSDSNVQIGELIKKQVFLNEEQENIRELLLKSRKVQKGTGHHERALAIIFSESVDILELSFAAHFDYDKLKDAFGDTGILDSYYEIIQYLGKELEALGEHIATSEHYEFQYGLEERIGELKSRLLKLEKESSDSVKIGDVQLLFNVLNHIKRLHRKTVLIKEYHNRETKPIRSNITKLRLDLFTQHQTYAVKPFISNLSWKSIHFKHALRTAITFAVGIAIGIYFPHQKSYWILLTISIILRPNYSLTLQKANQRVVGTIVGALLGFGIVSLPFFNNTIGIVVLIFAAWGSFTFNVLNYRTSVVFTTIVALMSNYFILPDFFSIFEQRILDTLIGAGLSMIALYVLWPGWESQTIADKLVKVLEANRKYIASVKGILFRNEDFKLNYKLARRESLVNNSDLSSAFQRMLDNPSRSRFQPSRVYNFTTMNYQFMSHTAAVGSQLMEIKIHNKALLEEWSRNIDNIESIMQSAEEIIRERYLKDKEVNKDAMISLNKTRKELESMQEAYLRSAGDSKKTKQIGVILTDYTALANQFEHLAGLSRRILRQSGEFGKELRKKGL